jgi:hypothetical protein
MTRERMRRPTKATILTQENTNSTSPKIPTSMRLKMKIRTRMMEIQTAGYRQYLLVNEFPDICDETCKCECGILELTEMVSFQY